MNLEKIANSLSRNEEESIEGTIYLIENLKKNNKPAYKNFRKLSRIYYRKKLVDYFKKSS